MVGARASSGGPSAADAVLMRAVATRAMEYPFKYRATGAWGFGEDICLRALLEYGELVGDDEPLRFVAGLVRPWCEERASGPALPNADHVAPGIVLLDLHRSTRDEVYLAAALELGELYRSFTEVDGVPVHRPDLAGLDTLIWVDCIALDAPFLARLSRVTGDEGWLELGLRTLQAYSGVLLDRAHGLFRHGYDVVRKRQSPCLWGRGNGWALHGLVDTLEELPTGHAARAGLLGLLRAQVSTLVALQASGGLWHTILNDEEAPLESSTAAFYASGVSKALRLGLLEASSELEAMVDLATKAARVATDADGRLPISYATPVGEPATYINAPSGVFPWGQGPLLLTLIETHRRQDATREGANP